MDFGAGLVAHGWVFVHQPGNSPRVKFFTIVIWIRILAILPDKTCVLGKLLNI